MGPEVNSAKVFPMVGGRYFVEVTSAMKWLSPPFAAANISSV